MDGEGESKESMLSVWLDDDNNFISGSQRYTFSAYILTIDLNTKQWRMYAFTKFTLVQNSKWRTQWGLTSLT